MKEEKGSRKFIYLMIGICSVCTIILIISCFIFFNRTEEVKKEERDGGEVTLSYTDDINIFSISGVSPTTDAVGMTLNSADQFFDFTVNTEFDEASEIDYEIYVEKYGNTPTIKDKDIRIYLEKQNSGTYEQVLEPIAFSGLKAKSELGTPRGAMIIYKDSTTKDITEII